MEMWDCNTGAHYFCVTDTYTLNLRQLQALSDHYMRESAQ